MKTIKYTTVILFISILTKNASSQQQMPKGVQFNFETMFPSQSYDPIYVDTLENYYIPFKTKSKLFIARYSKEGYWQFSGNKLTLKEAPQDLSEHLLENYLKDKKTVYTLYKIETPFYRELYYLELGSGKNRKHYILNEYGVVLGN